MTQSSSMPMTSPKAHSTIIRAILLLLAVLGLPWSALAQTYTVTPAPFETVLDNSGRIVSLGCVWTYVAGTTTPVTTYTTATGTANANPIIADSAGRFTAFLSPGNSYKFVYENVPCSSSAHGSTLRTADGISAMPSSGVNVDVTGTAGETLAAGNAAYLSDGSGGNVAGQWYKTDADFVYASSTAGIVGIATAAISSGASGSLRISGRATGLSGLTPGSTYYVSATAGSLTATAPSNLRFVGEADSTTSVTIAPNPPPISASATIQTTVLTGTQNNFAATTARRLVLYINNATALTITGIAAGVNDGDEIEFAAFGAGSFTLSHQSGSSTAANRIITPNGVDMTVTGGVLEYDNGTARWRVLAVTPSPTAAYTTTTLNVTTNTITTFCSFAVPSMAAGDWIDVTVPRLKKNNKGTDGNATFTFAYGGASTADAAVSWVDSATEYGDIDKFLLFRVGADLWVWRGTVDSNPYGGTFTSGTSRGNQKVVVSAPTFTSSQTVALKLTLAATDATFYYKPQSCTVMHYKALQ